jgi:hypothetical protein
MKFVAFAPKLLINADHLDVLPGIRTVGFDLSGRGSRAKRRDAMAAAAAPYLHPKVNAIDAKLSPAAAEPLDRTSSVLVKFVVPGKGPTRDMRTRCRLGLGDIPRPMVRQPSRTTGGSDGAQLPYFGGGVKFGCGT